MTVRTVCDSSTVVALLLDSGPNGLWAQQKLSDTILCAPALMPFECANVIRRQELSRRITAQHAVQARINVIDLAVELWPYDVLAERIWELRANLSSYDAAYVALAELMDATLVTLDHRIARSPGVQCVVEVPPKL